MMRPKLSISLSHMAHFLGATEEQISEFVVREGLASKKRGGQTHLMPAEARRVFEHFEKKWSNTLISVQMLKGGVAKTTTALNVALRARMYGARVLMIDLDQQGNLTYALGCEEKVKSVWVDIVEGKTSIQEARIEIEEGFHLIGSHLDNSVLERLLTTGGRNLAVAVSQYLKPIRSDYDLIIIDTAPNLSAINTSVSCASDVVLLPVNPDRFSFQGLQMTLDELDRIQEEFQCEFSEKIVFTRYDGRESASKEFLKACFKEYKEKMLKSFIRTSSDVKNSIRTGKTLFDSSSNGRDDYDLLTCEVLQGALEMQDA